MYVYIYVYISKASKLSILLIRLWYQNTISKQTIYNKLFLKKIIIRKTNYYHNTWYFPILRKKLHRQT